MKRDPSIWTKLSITTKDDRKVHGWYRTHDGMVTVETGLGSSRGNARHLIEQGGVRINGQKADVDSELKDGDVLQAGKRRFVRIRVG